MTEQEKIDRWNRGCAQRSKELIERGRTINHPQHYGGDSVYETIKVIEAWKLGFNLGNTLKYISRAGKKGDRIEDLKKALWYLQREIDNGSVVGEQLSFKFGNNGDRVS